MATRKAFALSFLDRYAGLVITLGTSVVIARLLTPAEIGLFSVTMVMVSIVSTFRDMGAGQYLVQERELTPERVGSTWAVQLTLGILLAIVTAALATPAARFYDEPQIAEIMWILAAGFAISPLGAVTIAWWTREMQFHWIAITRFVGAIAHAAAAIGLAMNDFGAASLAWASVASNVAGILTIAILRPRSLPLRLTYAEIRRVLSFGGRLTGISVLNTISNGAPEAFIGKIQDLTQAGFFSRAQGLAKIFNQLVMNAVMAVTLPLFSKTAREGHDVGWLYLKGVSVVSGLGWSFFLILALTAFPVTRLLYGAQWDESVPVTRVLCLVVAFSTTSAITTSMLIGTGRIRTTFLVTLIFALIRLAACYAGAMGGLIALAWALVASESIAFFVWFGVAKYFVRFDWRILFVALAKSGILALGSSSPFIATFITIGFTGGSEDWKLIVPLGIMSFFLFIVISKLENHPISHEVNLFLKHIRKKIQAIFHA